MYIYKLTNDFNDKVYIGQTTETLKERFNRHKGYNMRDNDTKLYRAMKKYGPENFHIVEIDTATTKEELDEKEKYWISKYDSVENGYNTALGSIGGDTLSHHPNLEEIKRKLSASKKGAKNPNARAVVATNVQTGEKVLYSSMKECQIALDIPRHDIIGRRCRGKIKKPYNDIYTFEYCEGVTAIENTNKE